MKTFVLIAGGTGGHLFPAMALAQELIRRGHAVELMTDHRVESYGADFPARQIHIVPAATPSGGSPLKMAGAGFTILRGIARAHAVLGRVKPAAVVGFGGYPTFPPFIAASLRQFSPTAQLAVRVVGPSAPATYRGRSGVANSSATLRASRAASRLIS